MKYDIALYISGATFNTTEIEAAIMPALNA